VLTKDSLLFNSYVFKIMTKVINVLEMENVGTQENRFETNKKNRLPKIKVS
jgi:hypothetical protein